MPDLRLNDIRLPELRLPEMSRDDIVQAMSDKRKDLDLGRFDPRRLELPDIDLSDVDVPKAVKGAAQAAGIVRTNRMPRLPFVIGGLVTLALVGFAVLSSPKIKPRLEAMAARAKERIEERRARWDMEHEAESMEPRAFDAAVAVPVDSSAYAGTVDGQTSPFDGPSDLPAGFGADVYHDGPIEETAKA